MRTCYTEGVYIRMILVNETAPMELKKRQTKQGLSRKADALYETTPKKFVDSFWIVDVLGNFLNVNSTFCRMIGYSRNEILEMNLLEIEAGTEPIEVIRHLHAIVSNGANRFPARYRCKDGSIIDVVVDADYLKRSGGKVFAILRLKGVDQLLKEETKKQEQSKEDLQERLAESYRQLGIVNRKIPLLLELGRYPRSEKHKQKIMAYVLNMAISVSHADTGFLYRASGKGEFSLLSAKGVEKDGIKKISVISPKTLGLLRQLIREKNRLSGDIKEHDVALFSLDNKLEYFVTLPLSQGRKLKGLIFLGFGTEKRMETQELEFLDVFSMHASVALLNAKALG